MTLRAAAFHNTVSAQALEEISSAAHGDLFGCTITARCSKCNARFIVFFPAKDDPNNPNYLNGVIVMIDVDCREGKHSAVYRFNTTP